MTIFTLALSSFWNFVGFAVLFIIAAQCLILMFGRILRTINIAIRGWPPAHLDADGDPNPVSDTVDRMVRWMK